MEELLKQHRQQQHDLESRITQKKKSATKKTRKNVNDECVELERQLKEKQDCELAQVNGDTVRNGQSIEETGFDDVEERAPEVSVDDIAFALKENSLSGQPVKATPAKKLNRQKARLARRAAEQEGVSLQAAEEAESLPDLREQERLAMERELKARGLVEKDIRSDGHCLYAAVADQLTSSGVDLADESIVSAQPNYKIIRNVAADFISRHPDDFSPFLEEQLDTYVAKIRDTGEWGGELELSALARAYNININVLQGSGRVENIESGTASAQKAIWLAYYRHSFGLGAHYNSLRQPP